MQEEPLIQTFMVSYEQDSDRIIFPYKEDYIFHTVSEVLEKKNKVHPEIVQIIVQALQYHSIVELINEIDYSNLWQSDNLRIYRFVL